MSKNDGGPAFPTEPNTQPGLYKQQPTLKVWWVPQIPMQAFEVAVPTLEEGARLLDTLAQYDLFQFEHKVKPDYSNMGGILMLEDSEWVDWYDEETGEDDPRVFVAMLSESNKDQDHV